MSFVLGGLATAFRSRGSAYEGTSKARVAQARTSQYLPSSRKGAGRVNGGAAGQARPLKDEWRVAVMLETVGAGGDGPL